MADAMAPVFDRQEEEERARMRLRNAELSRRGARQQERAWSVQSEQSRQLLDGAGCQVARDDGSQDDSPQPPQDTGISSTAFFPESTSSSASPIVTVYAVSVVATTSISSTSTTSSSISVSTATSTTSMVATVTVDTVYSASPTLFINDSGDNVSDQSSSSHHDSDSDNDSDSGPPGDSLSPSGEDALISAGSIGAFILVSFICWILWRTYKKSKRSEKGMYDGYSAPNTFFAKIPYLGRSQRGWQDLDRGGPPPMYEGPKSGIYTMTDGQTMMPPPSRQGPSSLPQLDTNVSYSNMQPFSASSRDTYSSRSIQSPQSGATINIARYAQPQQQQQIPSASQFQPQSNVSPLSQGTNRFVIPENATYDPSSTAQYAAGTMQTFDTTSSYRSRMPHAVYNQSELARQASTAYDPARRAVNRASELSSISSGFGDGDIIVPPPAVLQQNGESASYSYTKARDSTIQSNSTASPDAGDAGDAQTRRDTVYTTTSEDRPARYRSVGSWVNQQTGRVQRHQADAPPVPSLPPEDRYTMMMDDEEPRRIQEALPQPPVPSLPTNNNANNAE